jgi:hypothetical protein
MNGDTKLSEALKCNPEILEYVISLNPHDFERLRNPLMYRVMPVRITLRRLAAMVKIPEQEFVDKINSLAGQPLQKIDASREAVPSAPDEKPAWMDGVDEALIQWVDVLLGDEALADPMPPINIGVNKLSPGQVIGIKHKWQPQPFFDIWHSLGLEYWTRQMSHDEWHIFVYRPNKSHK